MAETVQLVKLTCFDTIDKDIILKLLLTNKII